MILLQGLAALAVLAVVLGLPGALASRLLVPGARGGERLVLTGVCVLSVGPLLLYLATTLANVPMTPGLIVCASLGASAAMGAVLWRRGAVDRPSLHPWLVACGSAVLLLLLLICSVQPIGGVDVFATIHHCMYVMVMYAIGNDPSVGVPMYDGIDGGVIHLLMHHPHDALNGLKGLFGEQRPGNVAILAPHVSLLGTLGWITAPVLASLVAAGACFFAARELGASAPAAALAVLAGLLGLHSFLGYVVNENLFGFALLAFLFWTGVKRDLSAGWLVIAGVVMAHVVGVRYTACLFWPALAWRFAGQAQLGRGARRALLWGLPAALLSLPWLALNVAMLDSAFAHPAIVLNLDRTLVENHVPLLGTPFSFKALNFPFVDSVVRAPWAAYPTALRIPLQVAQDFGVLFCGASALGLLLSWRRHRGATAFALAFALPHVLAIGLLENLNRAQLTYVALGLAPLLVWAALGLSSVSRRDAGEGTSPAARPRALLLGAVLLIALGVWGCRLVVVPPDLRQAGGAGADHPVAEELRLGLTTPRLLPAVDAPDPARLGHAAQALRLHSWRRGDGVYPSGGVALMIPFGRPESTEWSFELVGAAERSEGGAFRSSQGLQTVTLALPAERARVAVSGRDGAYVVQVDPVGPAAAVHDFTFFIHGWDLPTKSTVVSWRGTPLPDVRFEQSATKHEWRTGVTTNYPEAVVGMVQVPYRIDLQGLTATCGYFTFTGSGGGGHRHAWFGETTGTLLVPRGLVAERAVFLPDPFCLPGPPQPGARYAEARLVEGEALSFRVDQVFGVQGGGWLEFHDPPRGP